MDHCFYIAKRTVKPAWRNHSPGGFWVLLNAQKYQGKNILLAYISDITFKGGLFIFYRLSKKGGKEEYLSSI